MTQTLNVVKGRWYLIPLVMCVCDARVYMISCMYVYMWMHRHIDSRYMRGQRLVLNIFHNHSPCYFLRCCLSQLFYYYNDIAGVINLQRRKLSGKSQHLEE